MHTFKPLTGISPIAAAAIALTLGASSAKAQSTLFDNINGTLNNTTAGWAYTGGFTAMSFSTDSHAYNTVDISMEMTLAGLGTHNGTVNVSLYSDSSSNPGAYITTLGTVSESTLPLFNNSSLVDFGPVNASLLANSRYWVYITGGTQNGGSIGLTHGGVGAVSPGTGSAGEFVLFGTQFRTTDPTYTPIMKVVTSNRNQTVTTPEPGSMALLSGMLLAGGSVIRRRKARKA